MKHEILRNLMHEKDINQSDLSRETGVPQPTIHRILNGHTKSSNYKTMKSIGKYFDVSVDYLHSELE